MDVTIVFQKMWHFFTKTVVYIYIASWDPKYMYFRANIADDILDDISLTNFLPHNFLLVSCWLSLLPKAFKVNSIY